jgi:hypothetical protein
MADTARQQLAGFIAKYSPDIQKLTRAALTKMRARLPGAVVFVYDNYNALAVGFGPTERASEAVFSIAVFPRWVSLFFLKGATLDDPDGLLKGSGNRVRHIVLESAATLDDPGVRRLMTQAMASADPPFARRKATRLIIKSISPTQRPRRAQA